MAKRPWDDFSSVRLAPHARAVEPAELVDMADYRKAERMEACNGCDPIRIVLAYAQDELIYDGGDNPVPVSVAEYGVTPRERRLNKFGLAYRRAAKFYLHRTLADIVIGAAIRLYKTQGWTTVLYDGLRTMEGAYKLYCFASDDDIKNGLLALPGQSAHNKGLAVDSMMEQNGRELDMGGHFDHLDMSTNIRTYNGARITEEAKKNRLIREAAFLYSAFTQGLLVAPLRNEFWDDRLPENREDLWRVLDSAARCLGITLLSEDDEILRKANRPAFYAKWESWDYARFLAEWKKTFAGREATLSELLGVSHPPLTEKPEFYHGNYHPIYDRDLKDYGKNLTTA